jgi:NodT family efflux transporter outer membrane factor (OMF) lipoprotein
MLLQNPTGFAALHISRLQLGYAWLVYWSLPSIGNARARRASSLQTHLDPPKVRARAVSRARIGDPCRKEHCLRVFQLRLAIIAASLTLAACAVGPDFKSPEAPQAARYTPAPMVEETVGAPTTQGEVQALANGQDIPAQWWTLFRSSDLDQLIKIALQNNPNLISAGASLKAANEEIIVSRAGLFPNLNVGVNDTRERASPIASGLPSSFTEELNVAQAAFNASYTVDVFGATRRTIEQTRAKADYARFELEAAYLSLTSNIVTTAAKEASLRAQIAATQQVLDQETHQLDLLKRQFEFGAIPKANVLSQQSLVASTAATLPVYQKQLAQNRHLLAVLVGQLPSEATLPEFTLDNLHLPTQVPVSLPSSLVRQRPDLLASEAQLHQASAAVGIATAALYPSLTLSASYGREALGYSDLFKGSSTVWSIGAGLTQPLFNAGELRAERRAAIDNYQAAEANYRSTVLSAFENVADSLRALDTDAAALKAYADAASVAQQSVDLSQAQYRLGAVSFFQLLQNEEQLQQARVNLAQAQATRLADTAALFQSLGGGWWNRTEPIAAAEIPATTD